MKNKDLFFYKIAGVNIMQMSVGNLEMIKIAKSAKTKQKAAMFHISQITVHNIFTSEYYILVYTIYHISS